MMGKPHSGQGWGMGVPMRAMSSLDFSFEHEVLYDSRSNRRWVPHSGTASLRNSSTSRFSTAGMTASHSENRAFALSRSARMSHTSALSARERAGASFLLSMTMEVYPACLQRYTASIP